MINKIDSYESEAIKIQDIPFQKEDQEDYNDIGNVYFAFIDVLGFKNAYDNAMLMKVNENKGKNEDPNKKFRDVFNYFFELMNSTEFIQRDEDTYAGQTSDSLYFYTKRPDYLIQFIKIFILFNQYAMSKNVFFRGGIAQGKLTRNKKYQFYGDSVIKAYLLESIIAQKPVIYIDTKTRAGILPYLRKDEDFSEKKSFVASDNQRYYINPFYEICEESIIDSFADTVKLRQSNLADIQKVIEKNIVLFEYHPKTFDKYIFLKQELLKAINKETN